MGRQVFGTHMVYRETFFANPTASSSTLYPPGQGINPWISNVSEHTSPHVMSRRQTPHTTPWIRHASQDRQPEIHSTPVRVDSQRTKGRPTTTADFGSSFWQIPYTGHVWLLEDKIQDWGMYLFTISYGSYAAEVEMVVSVDDLKSSCSIRGTQTPDFEVLDAKIASALNRIVQNTRVKKKVSLEEMKALKEDRFLRGRQIAYLIYEYFRVTGANDFVEKYADLFTVVLRKDNIQEFDSKWDGISIVDDTNPIWWHLGKLVQIKNTRVWEAQDRVGIVWPRDSSEES